ncbi:MAG TPA: alpha/beta fold hydrolase [Longimicrobium sp.]|nr:alpha/beta fold hydrolase [Longimicrobium sp.]
MTQGPKDAVVLVHAFGSRGNAWAPQLAGLEDRYRLLAPDLPGHGDSTEQFTLRAAIERVVATIDGADGNAHLVGISGGAVVALLTCLEYPDRVRSLVLSAGVAHPPRWFALQRAVMTVIPEPLLNRALRGALSAGRPEYAQAAGIAFRRAGKPTYLAGLRAIAGLDLRRSLDRVAVPTLILCGSEDRPNIPLSEELAAGIPGAELEIVPGANHLWNLQQPDAFNEILAAFVDRAVPVQR